MRFVSILGDSISTYEGFQPGGYAVFYDRSMQRSNGLSTVYDTWWAKVNQALQAYLCVNNSYSGSRVTGSTFPAASSARRTAALHTAEHSPDLILIYIGFNDFGSGIPARREGHAPEPGCAVQYFEDAYANMLQQLRRNYPHTKIVCATLMRSTLEQDRSWSFPECFAGVGLEAYNHAIRRMCRLYNCYLADLSALNLRYETLDGTHPTKAGHHTLYQAWCCCLSRLGLL